MLNPLVLRAFRSQLIEIANLARFSYLEVLQFLTFDDLDSHFGRHFFQTFKSAAQFKRSAQARDIVER